MGRHDPAALSTAGGNPGDRELQRPPGDGGRLAIALVDLDLFKSINDRHGHPAGDKVLQEIAGRLVSTLPAGGCAGRYGGEEFLLVFRVREPASPARLMREVLDVLAGTPIRIDALLQVTVTASIGVSLVSDGDDGAHTLIERADAALYRAKAQGRNCVLMG